MFSRFNSNKWYDVLQYAKHFLLIHYLSAKAGRRADYDIKPMTMSCIWLQ